MSARRRSRRAAADAGSGASADNEMLTARLRSAGVPEAIALRLAAAGPYEDVQMLCAASEAVVNELADSEIHAALQTVLEPDIRHADEGTRDAARLALALYRDRFGYPFVTGIETPTAEELLMRVRIRLGNEATPEWRATREHLSRHIRACITRSAELVPGTGSA